MSTEYYQILCSGTMAMFSEKQTFYSKYVYTSPPSQETIDEFVKNCTNPVHEFDLIYLDKDKEIKTKVVKVTVVDNGQVT